MDASRILVALEEREKWRDRRARLGARLKALQARKRYMQRELDVVRRKVARLEDVLSALKDERVPRELPFVPFDTIR